MARGWRLLLVSLVLLLATSVSARRHRYGMWARNKARSHGSPSRASISANAALRAQQRQWAEEILAAEEELVEEEEEEISLAHASEDITAAVTPRKRAGDDVWPPKWTQPVVVVGTICYSSMFF